MVERMLVEGFQPAIVKPGEKKIEGEREEQLRKASRSRVCTIQ
jgi:hypothetical protein